MAMKTFLFLLRVGLMNIFHQNVKVNILSEFFFNVQFYVRVSCAPLTKTTKQKERCCYEAGVLKRENALGSRSPSFTYMRLEEMSLEEKDTCQDLLQNEYISLKHISSGSRIPYAAVII